MFWPLILADSKRHRTSNKIWWWTGIMVQPQPNSSLWPIILGLFSVPPHTMHFCVSKPAGELLVTFCIDMCVKGSDREFKRGNPMRG